MMGLLGAYDGDGAADGSRLVPPPELLQPAGENGDAP